MSDANHPVRANPLDVELRQLELLLHAPRDPLAEVDGVAGGLAIVAAGRERQRLLAATDRDRPAVPDLLEGSLKVLGRRGSRDQPRLSQPAEM
jgi:hypothetical protein